VSVRPDLKGKRVYFFPTLNKYFKGILIYEAKEKKAYIYSTKGDRKLKNDVRKFLYERIISIYMKSRQKSWRRFNDLIPEKGSSSLRENLKAMRNDTQISENKHTSMKKSNIPKDPMLGLAQLQIWAQLDSADELFSKMFLVSELLWLLWAFGDNVKNNKRKKSLIPLILEHLKKGTSFSNEAISKGQIFSV
jgi:hypothetical protein